MTQTAALIVGAGRGHRFGGDMPKQYQPLNGEPVLRHTLRAFINHPDINAVQAVIHPDDLELFEHAARGFELLAPVWGGESRQDSVRLGLLHLKETSPDQVLIHDAARPFVDADLISLVTGALRAHPGAIPALPVTDTLKRGHNRKIDKTVPHEGLWRAQTPQGFKFKAILKAHQSLAGQSLTDDATVGEHAGIEVVIVEGSEDNVKITTKKDLERTQAPQSATQFRTGYGYDVHAFGDGNHVVLCGVQIPHSQSLIGHSDADVALHAVTDALLGAIGAGDIGEHFPPNNLKWRETASDQFVRHAVSLIEKCGGRVVNVDVTLVCQAPKIGPYREAMCKRLTEILNIAKGQVSVKATTTEGLGFTGRNEGIAAHAITSVSLVG